MHPFSLNIKGRLVCYDTPQVMGIINVTYDSFYSASRKTTEADIVARTEQILREGGTMIDVGACSTRPGAEMVSEDVEIERMRRALPLIRQAAGDNVPLSVDTFRWRVARMAVEEFGADIVNDISGGIADNGQMFAEVARMRVPYVLMHMRGEPSTMQSQIEYSAQGGVVAGVIGELSIALRKLEQLGVADVIIDPGFGFAKSVEQNYEILRSLPEVIDILGGRPLLAGLSRKSMFWRPAGLTPDDVLPATTAANTIALMGGAAILRVHDVSAAVQAVGTYLSAFPEQNRFLTHDIH